ncbi:hypothetical protein CAS74_004776 [Pichia kudriavzevii]|uniref:PH domain-containing protein n=1 Tax=Pichia kudriavzevii TaxID=4909 RepID=A0A1Z8JHI9_PICKU|nr:hypothetical protein CAS74_004776 [Pichia kudriavzevii]
MLFFQSFNTAVPIFPNLTNSVSSFITPQGNIVNLDALEEACMFEPQVFKYSPYPVTQDYIEWVKPGIDQQTFKIHDSAALFEAKRRAFMISKGHTSIDLLNVVEINSILCDKQNNEVKKACNSIWGQSVNDMNGRKEAHYISLASNKRTKDTTSFLEEERYTTAYFDLKMSDGSSISFNASNILIKNEWESKELSFDKLHDPTADNRNINCSVPLEEVKHNIRELNFSGSSSELTDSEDDINIPSEESDAMIEFESETNKCDYYETIPLKHANKFQSTKLSHSFGTRERSLKLLARSKAERDLWIAKLNSEIDNLSTVSSINNWRI